MAKNSFNSSPFYPPRKPGGKFGQIGIEWLPKDSKARDLNWSGRAQPRRMYSDSYKDPLNYKPCFNCFEEALWYCDMCRMEFCRHDDCKEKHEYQHTLSRLSGERAEEDYRPRNT